MVRARPARPHPPSDPRPPPAGDRARVGGGLHAIPLPLAAPRGWHAAPRAAGCPRGHRPAPGRRAACPRLGGARAAVAHRALRPGGPRAPLPRGRRRLGRLRTDAPDDDVAVPRRGQIATRGLPLAPGLPQAPRWPPAPAPAGELTARESRVSSWRALLGALRTLEARGEVRGGRFVAGLVGEQFALPEAVETLRAVRRRREPGEVVIVSAADPLNLLGILLPGPRLAPTAREVIAFRDGVPVETGEPGTLATRLRRGRP